MSNTELRGEIRTFIQAIAGTGDRFDDADDLIERGIVKSINILEIITWVEDTYGCAISQRDVFEGNFRSVERLVAFVNGGRR